MSPEKIARAKRERWARQVNADLASWFCNAWYLLRNPVVAYFVTRLRLHYSLGFPYPSVPKSLSEARIRV